LSEQLQPIPFIFLRLVFLYGGTCIFSSLDRPFLSGSFPFIYFPLAFFLLYFDTYSQLSLPPFLINIPSAEQPTVAFMVGEIIIWNQE
jgi:hypothetical protein